MLISHAAISSGVAARPRSGLSAPAAQQLIASAEQIARILSRINMLDLAALRHAPARDAVEVVDRARAAIRDQLGACRLDSAGFVRRAALQGRGSAAPAPGDAEARHGLRQ